jgi:two-component system response regulator NreC
MYGPKDGSFAGVTAEQSTARPAKTVRILLADDHKIVRDGSRTLLSKIPGCQIVAEADNGRDAVALTCKLRPDVAILDVGMPELNGLDAARQIKKNSPETEVLVFTGQETEELIHQVFASGARSYIVKTDATEYLVEAVKALSEHKHFFTSRISEVVFARYLQSAEVREATPDKSRVTDREREVIQLLAEGKSNKDVAAILGISLKTAETHRASVMRKLGLESFAELVRYAIRNRIAEA